MREQEPTDWLNHFVNQERLDAVVRWHNENWDYRDFISQQPAGAA